MSPITHGMIGWLVSQPLKNRRDRILVTATALVPDLDGIGIILGTEYYAKFHHTFGHNFFFGILLCLVFLIIGGEKFKGSTLIFLSFNLHILCDLLGSGNGWGVPFLWPFNENIYEFTSPFKWELDSWQNLLVTSLCVSLIIFFAIYKKRTIVEVFSITADARVVEVFNRWFGTRKKRCRGKS